jgi:hypothetical protein
MAELLPAWASEAGHWYTRSGDPAYTVRGANGRERPTTLRDARRLGLLPSVTGIIKMAAQPALEHWRINQMMLAALTLPRSQAEAESAWLARVHTDSRETARKAAALGNAIHAALEGHFRGKPPPEEFLPHVRAVLKLLGDYCGPQAWNIEKSFAHPDGFGGKVDLFSDEWVIDYKSKEFDATNPPKIYDEHPMQLSPYRSGLGLPDARTGIVFVSSTVPGLVVMNELGGTDLDRGKTMFASLLDYWWAKNGTSEYHR